MTYTVVERGAYWIVSAGREVARYRKDEIAYNGYTDMEKLKREIRQNLNLARSDRLVIED